MPWRRSNAAARGRRQMLAAAVVVAAAAATAAATSEFVTPEIVEPAPAAAAAAAEARFAEVRADVPAPGDANKNDGIDAAVRERQRESGAGAGPQDQPPTMRTPYTYDNSQPAYRSTFYRYPWMHEPFGAKPMEAGRIPIGAHVQFPWQKEAREEYEDGKARERENMAAGGQAQQRLPHPLAMMPNEGVPRWATAYPFASPGTTYPYYPTAHAAGIHQFGYYGAGADALAHAHMHAHMDPSMPYYPGAPGGAGLMDPYFSVSPAMLAATQNGQQPLPYGAAWYGAGAQDLI